jgi:type VI protein secretion system component Hcp
MSGQLFQKAEIDFVRSSEGGGVFLKYELQDVIVSSLQDGGAASDAGNTPDESLSMNFSKLTISYYPQDAKGQLGPPIVASVHCTSFTTPQ